MNQRNIFFYNKANLMQKKQNSVIMFVEVMSFIFV